MDIDFSSKKLEKKCNTNKEAVREWGPDNAKKLRTRLHDLKAASNLEQMRNVARCHELKGDRKGQLAVDLKQPVRLIFEPIGEFSFKDDGGLDWNTIKAIRIIEVTDYHD